MKIFWIFRIEAKCLCYVLRGSFGFKNSELNTFSFPFWFYNHFSIIKKGRGLDMEIRKLNFSYYSNLKTEVTSSIWSLWNDSIGDSELISVHDGFRLIQDFWGVLLCSTLGWLFEGWETPNYPLMLGLYGLTF